MERRKKGGKGVAFYRATTDPRATRSWYKVFAEAVRGRWLPDAGRAGGSSALHRGDGAMQNSFANGCVPSGIAFAGREQRWRGADPGTRGVGGWGPRTDALPPRGVFFRSPPIWRHPDPRQDTKR